MDNIKEVILYGRKYYATPDGEIYTEKMQKKPQFCGGDGYPYIEINPGKPHKRVKVRVHRIIANGFLVNPDGLPEVNHIDGNKLNNNVSNLEWVTGSQNQLHNRYVLNNMTGFQDTPVMCVETGKTYCSTRAAWRDTNVCYSHISESARGKRKTAGGYHWKFIEGGD